MYQTLDTLQYANVISPFVNSWLYSRCLRIESILIEQKFRWCKNTNELSFFGWDVFCLAEPRDPVKKYFDCFHNRDLFRLYIHVYYLLADCWWRLVYARQFPCLVIYRSTVREGTLLYLTSPH